MINQVLNKYTQNAVTANSIFKPKDNVHYKQKLINSQTFTGKICLLYYSGDA